MEPLDGNAIAGHMAEAFGAEMTSAPGRCAGCGNESVVAELEVWLCAPGAVARCRGCGNVVLALVDAGGTVRVSAERFHWM